MIKTSAVVATVVYKIGRFDAARALALAQAGRTMKVGLIPRRVVKEHSGRQRGVRGIIA
jgi:hypothetical protein